MLQLEGFLQLLGLRVLIRGFLFEISVSLISLKAVVESLVREFLAGDTRLDLWLGGVQMGGPSLDLGVIPLDCGG